jgi:hypothetical protein
MSRPELQLSDVLNPPTLAEIKGTIYNTLARVGVTTTTWKPGAVVRTIISAVAIVLTGLSYFVVGLARVGFPGLSSGSWLTLIAKYFYGIIRNLAAFAQGQVTLTNTGGGIYNLNAGDLVVQTATGVQYVSTGTLALGMVGSSTAVASVMVQAVSAGSGSNAQPGAINAIISPSMPSVAVANPYALVGTDAESDASLLIRCNGRIAAASPNGARGAADYFARLATRADGSLIGVSRTSVSSASNTNTLTVTVATPSGAVSGTQEDPATDLGAVKQFLLKRCVQLPTTLIVQTGSTRAVDVAFWAFFDNPLDATTQANIVQPVLAAWFADMAIGGMTIGDSQSVYSSHLIPRDTIRDLIFDTFVNSAQAQRPSLVVVTSPAADIDLTSTPTSIPVVGIVLAQHP